MNLENQTVTGNDQVTMNDSLNAALMELTIKPTATSVAPNSTELYVYVDKQPKNNPSAERKQYLFDLQDILRFYNNVADEFKHYLEVVNNDIVLKSVVERKIAFDSQTSTCSILQLSEIEELESSPITLFEGTNYIYTNYENVDIELIYAKNNLYNKAYLNGSMYYNHKLRNDGEFCLDDIYFKDAFTKTGNNLNLQVNDASIDSLQSNSNAFSLDSSGNLIVNTISCNSIDYNNMSGGGLDSTAVCNLIYPVGSIYLSVSNTSPATLFGGTWEQIKDRFLLSAGNTYSSGSTGGEATHVLTANEMPSHTHVQNAHYHSGLSWTAANGVPISLSGYNASNSGYRTGYSSGNVDPGAIKTNYETATNQNTGGGAAHNNMPPYLTVYMWKRTA